MFRTHQDRLVKELAAAGITDMAAANRYLETTYLPACNGEFTQPPREEGSAFVACRILGVLDDILCEREVLPRNVRRAPPRPESPSGISPPRLSGRLINSGQFICYRTGHFYLLLTDITFLSAGVQDIPHVRLICWSPRTSRCLAFRSSCVSIGDSF